MRALLKSPDQNEQFSAVLIADDSMNFNAGAAIFV